ncbi:porin family protein [Polaribacter sargassicola]|uniref:type IX secretion/gliding motility protein PorT/SprT n=1 Tax=Polaribacter sargassicola TaxID=2836891 RepID=UPI001F365462|nr:porin family protein [Polaribacter sp. DS7-9]MCG1037272.1 outer membrane beta-barrel protein [Polaribacter sp. DS7-9]
MSKKLIIFGFFIFTSVTFFSQSNRVDYLPTFDKRKIHYGFYLGLNQNDFKYSLKTDSETQGTTIDIEPSAGFNVGLITDLRLHKNLNLRLEPGLMTNTKQITFNNSLDSNIFTNGNTREVNSTFLHVPLLLKFSTDRLKNIRPYVIGGVSYNYNFSSNEDGDDNTQGQFRTKTHNYMYEVGLGIDIYLYYFKFSPSIRGVFAIPSELKYDNDVNSPYTSQINYLGTRGVFLTFAFE